MRTRLFASLLCLTALAACNKETPPGSLIVPFSIGADIGCSTLGVTQVTIELWSQPAEGAPGEQVDSATVSCEDGQAEFQSVPVGRYEVRASGVDMENVVIVDNGGKNKPDTAEVTSGTQNTADDVNMGITPAKLLVRWKLNDGFGQCTDVPAKQFEVKAYKNSGGLEIYNYAFDCDPAEDQVDGYNVVVDDDRQIEGDVLDLITINPIDAMGMDVTTDPLYFQMTPPGFGRTVKLTASLNCMGTDCTISCATPDPMDPDPMDTKPYCLAD